MLDTKPKDLMRGNNKVWTAQDCQRLRKLFDEGLSYKNIGERMGVGKNAITGKIHRLKFPLRENPIEKQARVAQLRIANGLAAKPSRKKRAKVQKKPTLKAPDVQMLVEQKPIIRPLVVASNVVALRQPPSDPSLSSYRGCQFITDFVVARPAQSQFCNAPCVNGRSWCSEHLMIVYEKLSIAKDAAK